VTLSGWLENVIGTQTCPPAEVRRINKVNGATLLASAAPARGTWTPPAPFRSLRDIGTMALTLLDPDATASAANTTAPAPVKAVAGRPLGGVRTEKTIPPGGTLTVTALVAWHFPNAAPGSSSDKTGREYATRFADAGAVADYVAKNFTRLDTETMRWSHTWNDSTLPQWALDRTFLNTSILATTTAYRFGDGRFWAWEGIGACEGTCTHVWGYGQAMGRLFPALERDLRTRTDFGLALNDQTGDIRFRGEHGGGAIDGQAMCILRTWREHTMTTDDTFLRPLWPKVKLAMEYLITKDRGDGLLDGAQHNTLDTDWHGQVAWLSGLYHAALRASEAMATDLGDTAFAERCRALRLKGEHSMVSQLYNGEYFINRLDPKFPKDINSGTGCHIDQVFGQSWAFQAGLGRILPEAETRSALKSLWRYNFCPDAGPWRALNKPGRWYGMAGDAGLLLTTFPRPDWDYLKATGNDPKKMWAAMYFNEYMTGFEWQVAGHMINEGMVTEGLAIARAIHDRYAPAKRNPYNEIECSDHYARAMASYGVFTALCGYRYHGPSGLLAFAPKLSPDHFKAAFTSAEGWGSYAQERSANSFTATLDLAYGKLSLKTLGVQVADGFTPTTVSGRIGSRVITGKIECGAGETLIRWTEPVVLTADESLVVTLR
jgi:hypothetical protein